MEISVRVMTFGILIICTVQFEEKNYLIQENTVLKFLEVHYVIN